MAENIAADAPPLGTPNLRATVPDLLIDAALPAIAYQVLSRHGVADVTALTAGAIFPVTNIARKFVATRSVDLIGVIILVFIAIGAITSLLSGNVLFVLIKESFITGLVGLLFLSSLLWKRPIIFHIARQAVAGDDPERLAWWNSRWEHERFRRTMRIMTTVWGVGYTLEAGIRVILALTLAAGAVVLMSPIMGIGTTIGLIFWTRKYGRTAQKRAARDDALATAASTS